MPKTLDLVREFLNTHPASAADTLETIEPEAAADLLAELPADDAATVAAHMVPGFMASCLSAMTPESAGRILDRMPARSAAMVLRYIDRDSRVPLVAMIGATRRAHVALILRQPIQTVGAWIDTQVPALRADDTVMAARDRLTQVDSAFERVFIVDDDYRLLGAVPVRTLLLRSPESLLSDLMEAQLDRMLGSLTIEAARDDPSWQHADIQPVVDASGRLLGAIRHADLRRALLPETSTVPDIDGEGAALELTHMVYLGLAEAINVTLGQMQNRRNGSKGQS